VGALPGKTSFDLTDSHRPDRAHPTASGEDDSGALAVNGEVCGSEIEVSGLACLIPEQRNQHARFRVFSALLVRRRAGDALRTINEFECSR
jgi:hypothetical protein